mgnify:CR=1 FL=1
MDSCLFNRFYKVKIPFNSICQCGCSFDVGEIWMPYHQLSKNRIMIKNDQGWAHKVKKSTFFRCCELTKEN